MTEIKKLTDKNGEEILPITNLSAVYDNEGHRMSDVMLTAANDGGSNASVYTWIDAYVFE